MDGVFLSCFQLQEIDISNFNTSNVINMAKMFVNCYKLKKINGLNKFITNKVTSISYMFETV